MNPVTVIVSGEMNGERNAEMLGKGNAAVNMLQRDGFVIVELPITLLMHMARTVGVMERIECNV
jgi:hypothetical protein